MWNTERECWKEKEKKSLKIKLKRRKGTNKKQNNQNLRKFGERLNVFSATGRILLLHHCL